MRNLMLIFALVFIGAVLSMGVFAEDYSFGTGNAEIEASLNEFNLTAKADLGAFSAEMSLDFGIPEAEVRAYVEYREFEPAEVYLALEIADIVVVEPALVFDKWEEDQTGGWGVVARDLGIKPGSPEFHELKNRIKGKSSKGRNKKD